jgi:hypothetical protein
MYSLFHTENKNADKDDGYADQLLEGSLLLKDRDANERGNGRATGGPHRICDTHFQLAQGNRHKPDRSDVEQACQKRWPDPGEAN